MLIVFIAETGLKRIRICDVKNIFLVYILVLNKIKYFYDKDTSFSDKILLQMKHKIFSILYRSKEYVDGFHQ